MARPRNPLSPRNRNVSFTGAEVSALLAKSRAAKKIRDASEFRTSDLTRRLIAPPIPNAAYSWDLVAIMNARDDQMRGRFATAVRLAESMRTNDAIFVARKNRLAPQRELLVQIVAAKGPRAGSIAAEGDALFGQRGVGIRPEAAADLNGCLADHGIAIGCNTWTPRGDGARIDVEHHMWPLEHVWWDESRQQLLTRTADGIEPIVHGDGRWVVYSNHEVMPWRQDAAVLPGALVWAAHAFAGRDWAKGSASHGNAKVVGTLPEGVDLQAKDADGFLATTQEAADFLALLQDIASLDTPVGIKPFGSTVDYLTNGSRAWEVWERLMLNRERAAARIYLGTDGTLGAAGGAPGVDISALLGVARPIITGDLGALERGALTGTIEPWCAVNFGDSALAPRREYIIPQPDADAVTTSYATRSAAFWNDVTAAKATGMLVDAEFIEDLAERHDVIVPRLPEVAQSNSTIARPPT